MKLIVELDISESTLAINNGTLAALIDSLSAPRIGLGSYTTRIATPEAAGAPQTATTPEATKGLDFAKAAEDARLKSEAAAKAKADADAKATALKAAKIKAKEAADAAAALAASAAALEDAPAAAPATAANTDYTLEGVRAVLAKINKAGKTAQVKALLAEFGATKLTEISPASYQALMEKAETL